MKIKKELNIKEINDILPHKYPFQMVDKIIEIKENSIVGVKNVTINEAYFKGHFPENPIMPGILQIESLAQTGGILILSKIKNYKNYWPYLISINNCKFKKIIIPGDTLLLKCKLVNSVKLNFIKMKTEAFVNNNLTCESIMLAKLIKKKK